MCLAAVDGAFFGRFLIHAFRSNPDRLLHGALPAAAAVAVAPEPVVLPPAAAHLGGPADWDFMALAQAVVRIQRRGEEESRRWGLFVGRQPGDQSRDPRRYPAATLLQFLGEMFRDFG
eukprot:14134099-Alexandrium_andersonii.AAC.1